MIFTLILGSLVDFVSMLFLILPDVSVGSIPVFGSFVKSSLELAVSYINLAIQILPYLGVVWYAFLYVIIWFEGFLLVAKFFFGHRTPISFN